jgi:hypothetical protein
MNSHSTRQLSCSLTELLFYPSTLLPLRNHGRVWGNGTEKQIWARDEGEFVTLQPPRDLKQKFGEDSMDFAEKTTQIFFIQAQNRIMTHLGQKPLPQPPKAPICLKGTHI